MRIFLVAALVAAALLGRQSASAAELKLLTTGAFKPIAQALLPRFEAASGDTVAIENDTAGGVLRRIQGGTAFDLVVLTPAALRDLETDGKLVPGSRTDLAKTGVGVAVKAGAPHPDIGSVAAFTHALLEAKSVAYIDPKSGGSSGVYVAQLLQRLGIGNARGTGDDRQSRDGNPGNAPQKTRQLTRLQVPHGCSSLRKGGRSYFTAKK
jgi:molybdate transport system substrate-binding protein